MQRATVGVVHNRVCISANPPMYRVCVCVKQKILLISSFIVFKLPINIHTSLYYYNVDRKLVSI